MLLQQILENSNRSVNVAAHSLQSENPFGGNRYLMTGLSAALGLSALYLSSAIVFASLALAFKGTCYGLAISYFSKNPNTFRDCSALFESVFALMQNPSIQAPLFFQNMQNFMTQQWTDLLELLKGERRLFNQAIVHNSLAERANIAFNYLLTAVLMTTLAYSAFYSALGIILKGSLVAVLSSSSLYLLNLRNHPGLWNEDIRVFLTADSLENKIRLLTHNISHLLMVKLTAFTSFLYHEHFSAPTPAAQGDQEVEPIAAEVLSEVPIELRRLSRMATILFSTAQEAAAELQRSFALGAPGNR